MEDPPIEYQAPPTDIAPMLAVAGALPPDDGSWSFEFKWDGIRAIGHVDGGRIRFVTRNQNDVTASFPELRPLGERFGARQAVLDGEIVAFDEKGRPRFQQLQTRIHVTDAAGAKRRAAENPAVYIVFDLLYLDGHDLVDLPYHERRRLLENLGLDAAPAGPWMLSPRFDGPGIDIVHTSREQGLEGVVAKRSDSPYLAGRRSPAWTKVKNIRTQEVVIGGWTAGQGYRRRFFGSLLLGIPDDDGLAYVGQVGTGFSDAVLEEMTTALEGLARDSSPFTTDIPNRYRSGARWVEPRLVGEVAFGEWTREGRMRHPSWRGLRDDKSPGEVRRES